MIPEFEVIVIGVGGMGSAACFQLARRGVRVLGLDRFGIPNTLGSSHGHSRLIRMAYYEHPDYVPLLRRSYELWNALQSEAQVELLTLTGGLYIGRPESRLVSGSLLAARKHDLAHQHLAPAELRARFPQFQLTPEYSAMYEKTAGVVRPELAVATFARGAMASGAELHGHEPVLSWTAATSGVEVVTAKSRYAAERLVVCGGPWSSTLCGGLDVSLQVTRQLTVWISPTSMDAYAPRVFPTWALALNDDSLYYGFPALVERPGLKVAHHRRGPETDPDHVNRDVDPNEVGDLLEGVTRLLPELSGPILSMDVCLYTNSPDGHFIIDTHPEHDSVVMACGFSGHGFKFAPVIGEALADLAQYGKTSLPIQFLGLKRFAANR